MEQQLPMYVWAGAVALAIVAAAWSAKERPGVRPTLPLEHVAGAALVGLFGWEALVHLPGVAMVYWTLTAGLGDVRGVESHQAYVVAQGVFVIGAAFAVAGILRRRTWGSVLGIGLAAALVLWNVLVLVETTTLYGESMGSDAYYSVLTGLIGMQSVPALAAVALLAWPFARRPTPRVDATGHDWPGAGAQVERSG